MRPAKNADIQAAIKSIDKDAKKAKGDSQSRLYAGIMIEGLKILADIQGRMEDRGW